MDFHMATMKDRTSDHDPIRYKARPDLALPIHSILR